MLWLTSFKYSPFLYSSYAVPSFHWYGKYSVLNRPSFSGQNIDKVVSKRKESVTEAEQRQQQT